MKEMKLVAVVVLFKPDLSTVIRNILTYINDVDRLLIYRNSEVSFFEHDCLKPFKDKIVYIGTEKNVGIAAALSESAQWAITNNFTHLLTLDQDSYFPEGQLVNFKALVVNSKVENVGVYGANPNNRGELSFPGNLSYLEVNDAITSGSIFPVEIFKECGLFENELFIDAVDYEFCYRIKTLKGAKTIVFPEIILDHEVGYPTKIKFGFTTDNYSAFRTYHIVRNHIIIWRRYPTLFQPGYKKTLIKIHIFYRLAKVMIGEENKIDKINSIIRGVYHGLSGHINFK